VQSRRPGFGPLFGKIPWRKERRSTAVFCSFSFSTPVFLPGEFHDWWAGGEGDDRG